MPDDASAISELARILRPGGVALVQVPLRRGMRETDEDPTVTDPEERHRRFGQFDHVRIYGMDLVDRLVRGGFEVGTVRAEDRFGPEGMARHGLWNDTLFVCRKPGVPEAGA